MLFSDWYIKVETIASTTGTGGWQYVTSANEKCYLTTYPKHCTTYQFLEKQGYLEGYQPIPAENFWKEAGSNHSFQDMVKKCTKQKNCQGSYVINNGGVGTLTKVEYFCEIPHKQTMIFSKSKTGLEKYKNENCIDQFQSSTFEMQEYGWMPHVKYEKRNSSAHCSKDTDLEGYYSWKANRQNGICGISGSNATFCKFLGSELTTFPESGFKTFSKKKECEHKKLNCQKIDGTSSVYIIFFRKSTKSKRIHLSFRIRKMQNVLSILRS